MFFKHFASKNQLPGLSVSGTLVENGLIKLLNQWKPYNKYNTVPRMLEFIGNVEKPKSKKLD